MDGPPVPTVEETLADDAVTVAALRGAITVQEQRAAAERVAKLTYMWLAAADAAPVLLKAMEEWDDEPAKMNCAEAVTHMVCSMDTDEVTFDTLSEPGVVAQLLKFLTNDSKACRRNAGRGLWYLSTNDAAARKLHYFHGFNETLKDLVNSSSFILLGTPVFSLPSPE